MEPTLLGEVPQENNPSELLAKLKNQDGCWLDSLEIRQQLEKQNSVLPRTAILCNASGHYSVDIQVYKFL